MGIHGIYHGVWGVMMRKCWKICSVVSSTLKNPTQDDAPKSF